VDREDVGTLPPDSRAQVGAIEEFAKQLAGAVRRYLRLRAWRDTECIVIGGGIRQSRIGELMVGRAAVILKSERVDVDLVPIRAHPDEAGLIGCAHLAPAWLYQGFGGLLAVDIGGSNIRTGAAGRDRLTSEIAPDPP
jgi:hypothetical protein